VPEHTVIDVFLVPLGRNRFEPYFEPLEGDTADPGDPESGWLSRMWGKFAGMIRDAEERRHERALHDRDPSPGLLTRVQRKMMSWIAERVAEQRLLWKLRSADEAVLHVPANLSAAEAEQRLREVLKRDETSHFRRLIVHTIALLLAAPLALLPGPNFLGLFFTFTVVSHFLSYRGARRGLSPLLRWRFEPSAALGDLQAALTLDFTERHQRIHAIGEQLRLRRLPTFVERMIAATA
jgi:hypothetical protein